MDQDRMSQQQQQHQSNNLDGLNTQKPQSQPMQNMHSDTQSQHASQNGDNYGSMMGGGGLASRRGANDGGEHNNIMGSSVLDTQSQHRYDQGNTQDMNMSHVNYNPNNYNNNGTNMMGGGQQLNMNNFNSLQDQNNSGQFGQSQNPGGNSNPMPQLQQLMMLLQQNQQQNNPHSAMGGVGGPGPNNSSFGPGLMQAAQMLVQSQNQASRFDTNKNDSSMYRMNPGCMGGPFDQTNTTSMLNQSMNFGPHGGIPQPSKNSGGYLNMPDAANNTHSAQDMQQHLGTAGGTGPSGNYRMPHEQQTQMQPGGGQQRADYGPRDMAGMPGSMQIGNNGQWINHSGMNSHMINNYMPGTGPGGINSGPPNHGMPNQMPGSRSHTGMGDQTNSPGMPWGVGSNYGGGTGGGQRSGLDNAYDIQNMSMASLAPQPLDHQMKAQQQAYPSHYTNFLNDDRTNQGPGAGMGNHGGPTGGPKGFNDNRDNRDKYYPDDYGNRNRMSSMNIGNPGTHNEGSLPNNRGGGGQSSQPGVSWLSQQNNNHNEYPQQHRNDNFKMQDRPINPSNPENQGGVMWLSSQNNKGSPNEDDNPQSKQEPGIVWPSRAPQNRDNDQNSEYNPMGPGPARNQYDSRVDDNQSQKQFGRGDDQSHEDDFKSYWPSAKQNKQVDLNASQNFQGNEGSNRFGAPGQKGLGGQVQSEDNLQNNPPGGPKGGQGQYNNLNSGRFGASNESAGAITPTNTGNAPELGGNKNFQQQQNSVKRQGNNRDAQSDNLLDEEAFKQGDGDNYEKGNQGSENRAANAIDDIPIPVSKPKTFEELLEEEMAKGNAGGIVANPRSPSKQHQDGSAAGKKEFLKRKNTNYGVPTGRQKSQSKRSYRYYTDNFDAGKRDASRGPTDSGAQSRQGADRTTNNSVNKFEAPLPGSKPTFNQWQQQMSEEQDKIREQKSPNSSNSGAVVKRPFLARGSGKAGGKGLKSSNSKTPLRQQQNKEAQGNATGMKSPLNNEYLYDQAQSNNNFESQLDTFKSLEDRAREQSKNLQNQYLENQKKNQKLFEDDSEEENDSTSDPKEVRDQNHLESEDNRSNLVKKMFYKDKDQHLRKSGAESLGHSSKMGAPTMSNLPESVQRMLEEKKEQLDKAMKFYNAEQQKLNSQKQIYDQQMKKLKIDQKELDVQRKRQKEQFEKMKEEEMTKIKAQKRIIEQRQKNVALANNSSKREKDEIDSLRKQLTAVKEELAQKEKYSKAQIDRLNRQINDLRAENGELRDEIAHYDQELRELREQQFQSQLYDNNQPSNQNSAQAPNNKQQFSGIGQGVLNRRGSRNSGSVQRQNSNTRNQNANAVSQKHSRQSAQARQTSIEEFQNQEKQIKDQEDYAGSNMISRGNDPQNRLQGNDNSSLANLSEVNEQQQNQNEDHETPNLPADNDDQIIDNEQEDYEMKFPHQYHNKDKPNSQVQDQIVGNDGKVQRTYLNGKKEVIFSNGVRRETFPDGYTIVYFNNNDIKQTYPDQKIVYYFAEAKTTQTTYPDGLQVFKFSNSQIEKHYSDGTKEIIFPDGTIKCIFADGEEESIFTDGTIQRIEKNGVKAIEYASGQKDILYPDGMRVREYPDGRIKTTYPDGTTENQIKRE